MRKTTRYTPDVKEKAIALWLCNGNVAYVADQLKLPNSTINQWIKKYEEEKGTDFLETLRNKKKMEFAVKAWEVVDESLKLIQRQVTTAMAKQAQIETLIKCVEDNPIVTEKQKRAMVDKLKSIEAPSLRDLTIVFGTIYDKQSHAAGEMQARTDGMKVVFNLPRPAEKDQKPADVIVDANVPETQDNDN